MKYVFLFESVHRVLNAEKILKENGIVPDLIPVPREVHSDCGVALELGEERGEKALQLLAVSGITPKCYAKDKAGQFSPVAGC